MPDVRLSVALCTYQGDGFLQEQLDSIAGQSRPPEELVICDDGSTDATWEILNGFRAQASFPVQIHVNAQRLGSTKNFERAIALCEGDLIFLSDQDDIWHPEKLSTLVDMFLGSPGVGAVFSDAEVVDERLAARGYSVWKAFGFTAALQRRFARRGALDVLLKRNVVAGMTMGFRSRFRDLVIPIPADWVHDRWIPLLIAGVSEVKMVPKRLVEYRQHGEQEIGVAEKKLGQRLTEKRETGAPAFLRLSHQYAAAHERLTSRKATYPCSARVLRQLEAKSRHFRARADMRTSDGRLRLLAKEILALNYQRYSSGWKSIAVDVFLS